MARTYVTQSNKTNAATTTQLRKSKRTTTDGSGIARQFFMFLSCWKWNDMSVQSTISMTSVRKYLSTKPDERVNRTWYSTVSCKGLTSREQAGHSSMKALDCYSYQQLSSADRIMRVTGVWFFTPSRTISTRAANQIVTIAPEGRMFQMPTWT